MYYCRLSRNILHPGRPDWILWTKYPSKKEALSPSQDTPGWKLIKLIASDDPETFRDEEYNALYPETHHYDAGEVTYK